VMDERGSGLDPAHRAGQALLVTRIPVRGPASVSRLLAGTLDRDRG
jgi:hypothetical protein